MAQINSYSDISTFVNTVFEDALFVARDNNLMASLVTGFTGQGMALRKSSIYGTASMYAVNEADDLTSQAFTPSVLSTLTPAEVGAQFFLTDQRIESDIFGARQDAAMELGMAMSTKIEKDLLGNFSSLTGGTVGAAGTAITWGYFHAMLARLRAQNAPAPYYFVVHPYQWHVLGKAASVASSSATNASDELLNDVNRAYFVQRVNGVNIFVSSNIAIDTNDDAYCAMFSPAAMALDVRRAPRLEPERDASRRGWELNMSAIYAHGVWRPAFGIQGIFDAATPTS